MATKHHFKLKLPPNLSINKVSTFAKVRNSITKMRHRNLIKSYSALIQITLPVLLAYYSEPNHQSFDIVQLRSFNKL